MGLQFPFCKDDCTKNHSKDKKALNRQAAVALLGPRQVGKTTLARSLENENTSIYLYLEWPEDRQKLKDPAFFSIQVGLKRKQQLGSQKDLF